MDHSINPRQWSTDQVVDWIQTSIPQHAASQPHATLPNLEDLATKFREHEIYGEALLNSIDAAFLKDECNVRIHGRRAIVLSAIEALRAQLPGSHEAMSSTLATPLTISRLLQPAPDHSHTHQMPHDGANPRAIEDMPSPSNRQYEMLVTDSNGNKRRRLQLLRPPTQAQSKAEREDALGFGRFTVDDIFYGKADLAQTTDIMLDQCDDDDFCFTYVDHCYGVRAYVQRRLQRFLHHQSITEVPYLGRKVPALLPYNRSQIGDDLPQSMTIFPGSGDDETAIRIDDSMLDDARHSGQNSGHWQDWSRLLDSHPSRVQDQILPEYKKSESCSITSSLAAEIEQEEKARKLKASNHPSRKQVEEAVAASTARFRDEWKQKKLPRLEAKFAYDLWCSARRSKYKHAARAKIRSEISHLASHLARMQRDIAEQDWDSIKALEKQCVILKPTVGFLRFANWQNTVLDRLVAPPRPPTAARGAKPAAHLVTASDCDSDSVVEWDMETIEDRSEASDSDSLPLVRRRSPWTGQPQVAIKRTAKPSRSEKRLIHSDDDEVATSSNGDVAARNRFLSTFLQSLVREVKQGMANELLKHSPADHWLQSRVSELFGEAVIKRRAVNSTTTNGIIHQFAKLYRCWLTCSAESWDMALTPQRVDQDDLALWAEFITKKLAQLSSPRAPERGTFRDPINLASSDHEDNDGPEGLFIADDADTDMNVTPVKKKKKKPQKSLSKSGKKGHAADQTPKREAKKPEQDLEAERTRNIARTRLLKFEESHMTSEALRSSQLTNSNDDDDPIIVNVAKDETDLPIYFNRRIARKLKTHQIDGVRFLWRETTLQISERPGCILAHTMGLGKTCQALTFLVTLKETQENPSLVKQLPEDLKSAFRVLILCPSSLLSNWTNEIRMWSPTPSFFNIWKIDSTVSGAASRLRIVEQWSARGGLLIIGYPLFKMLRKGAADAVTDAGYNIDAVQVPTESDQADGLSSGIPDSAAKQAIDIWHLLTQRPNMVIADEAHEFKNDKSKGSLAVQEINTRRRIGLTGTPMSNKCQEIFAMVNWVAPNYLGSRTEFNERFASPIEEGNYADSSAYSRRKARQKLEVLRRETEPKIHRLDIEVLKGSLPGKTEYVLTVTLSDIQARVYTKMVDHILGHFADEDTGNNAVQQTMLFGWLHDFGKLGNHPSVFLRRLDAVQSKPPTKLASREHTANESGEDEEQQTTQWPPEVFDDLLTCLRSEVLSEASSHRMSLIIKILRLSISIGDRVLIFSHSLHTLDYLGGILNQYGVRYGRIDGSLAMPARELVLKDFRNNKLDVLLLSTRAAGTGLNIQQANRVIIVDYSYNPTHETQAVGRAYRLGQRKHVFVYRFVIGGTWEDKMYNMGVFKSQLSSRVVDKKNPQRHAVRMQDWIFHPKPVKPGPIDEERGKDPEVLDRILADQQAGVYDAHIMQIKTMETLEQEDIEEPWTAEEQLEVENEAESLRTRRLPVAAMQRTPVVQGPPPLNAPVARM